MPPAKKEAAAAVTPATVANGLASTDPVQRQSALAQLAAAGQFSSPQAIAEILQLGICSKLVELLQQPEKAIRLLACRQLALYAGSDSPLQQAVASTTTVQVLWSVLQAYAETEAAIRAALSDPAAVRAAAAKKTPGAPKDPMDPDEWLPGPSKFLLEAALRALSSLASVEAVGRADTAAPNTTSGAPAAAAADTTSNQLCAWMCCQDSANLVCLLRHPSGRVKMRAMRLALQLAKSHEWCESFAASGGVTTTLQLAALLQPGDEGNSSIANVQLTALQLLVRLMRVSHVAAAGALQAREPVLDGLMSVVLAAGTAAPPMPAASANSKSKATGADASSKPVAASGRDMTVSIQCAAAELLALACATESQACQLLLDKCGLLALLALMPDPPATQHVHTQQDSCLGELQAEQQQQADLAGGQASRHGNGAGREGVVPPLSLPMDAAGSANVDATQPPHQATPKTCIDSCSRPVTPSPAPLQPYSVTQGKLHNPYLQARVLNVIAAVLTQPQTTAAVLQACPQLPRLLLHMFAAATSTDAVVDEFSSNTTTGTSDPSSCLQPAPPGKTGPGAASVAGSKSATQTPRGSAAVTVKGPGSAVPGAAPAAQQGPAAGQLSSNGAATPRKSAAPAAAVAISKAHEPTAGLLGPPYPACTKAAALACLKWLAHHKQGVAMVAAEQCAAAATQHLDQDQQQPSSRAGVGMLQQVLMDIAHMATAVCDHHSHASTSSAVECGDSTAEPRMQQQQQLVDMLGDAACFMEGLIATLQPQLLLELPLADTLQVMAQCAKECSAPAHTQQAVKRVLLALPEDAFVPPPRPPLPSPPATPPPPPLPTSQFTWDALDRPCVTDGAVVVSTQA